MPNDQLRLHLFFKTEDQFLPVASWTSGPFAHLVEEHEFVCSWSQYDPLLPTALMIPLTAHLNKLSGSEAHGPCPLTSHAPENLEGVPVLVSSLAVPPAVRSDSCVHRDGKAWLLHVLERWGAFSVALHVVIEKDVSWGRKVCYSYPEVCAHLDGVIVVSSQSVYSRLYWEDSTYISIHQNIYLSLHRHFQPHTKPSLCFHRVPSTEMLILIQQMAKDQAVLGLWKAYCEGEACRSIQWETQALQPWDEDAWLVYCMCHHKCLHRTFACRRSATGSCKTFMGSPPVTSSLPGFPGGCDLRHLHRIASISLESQCSEDEAIRKQCTILR